MKLRGFWDGGSVGVVWSYRMCVWLSKFLFVYVCMLSCSPLPHHCSPQICGNGDGIISVFLRILHSIITKKPVVLLLPPPFPPHSKSGKQGGVFAASYSLALLRCPTYHNHNTYLHSVKCRVTTATQCRKLPRIIKLP